MYRMGTYLFGQTKNDPSNGVKHHIIKEKVTLGAPNLKLRVHRDTPRFLNDEVNKIMASGDGELRDKFFSEPIEATGVEFGPSWSTHWFHLELLVPEKWLEQSDRYDIQLIWNSSCEASIFGPFTTDEPQPDMTLIQAFSEESREVFKLKQKGGRDDLKGAQTVQLADGSKCLRVAYVLEIACNMMLGNSGADEPWGGRVDMNKKFSLQKCELQLIDPLMHRYFYDMVTLRDAAQALKKQEDQCLAEEYQSFIYDMSNEYVMPITDAELNEALAEIEAFMAKHKSSEHAHRIFACGHCHIDTAWMWPYEETKRKVARSWASQLEFARMYPDFKGFKFSASSAAHYWWLERHYPELFKRVQQGVKDGVFEVVGGTWVEFDGNLPSAESMTRQFLHGQRYFRQKFGKVSDVFFLPDTFGYSPQLPQIGLNGGVKNFVTIKIAWSNFNKFPHHTFYWKGIDGSQLFCHFPPADTYLSDGSMQEVRSNVEWFRDKGRSDCTMLLFGQGDGGGGPQIDHIERLRRLKDLNGVPQVQFATFDEYFSEAKATANKLMTWEGELYLEAHNGTYTSMAEIKYLNRYMEHKLRDTEILFNLASLLGGPGFPTVHSQQTFTDMWHEFMIHQFHDVLPGTCTLLTIEDVRKSVGELQVKCDDIAREALLFLTGAKELSIHRVRPEFDKSPELASLIFSSSLNAQTFNLNQDRYVTTFGLRTMVPLQEKQNYKLSFEHNKDENVVKISNAFYSVAIDMDTGLMVSYKERRTKRFERELVKPKTKNIVKKKGQNLPIEGAFNQLIIHDDVPYFWDNWDTCHHTFETKYRYVQTAENLKSKSYNVHDHLVEVSFSHDISELSQVTQTMCFHADKARIDFKTHVNWQESRKLLKAYFPAALNNQSFATFEATSGLMRRPTHANTSWDAARFEVCAHRFTDVGEPNNVGIAVINDCKYGYSVRNNDTIGLTLLKAGQFPYEKTDKGSHEFVYSLLVRMHGVESGEVQHEAANLNQPVYLIKPTVQVCEETNFIDQELLELAPWHVTMTALKQSEDDSNVYIIRFAEQIGQQCMTTLQFNAKLFKFKRAWLVDGLERTIEEQPEKGSLSFDADTQTLNVLMHAFKITAVALAL